MDISTRTVIDQYYTSSDIQIRMNLYEKYNNNEITWPNFVFNQIKQKEFSTLLEVGCGNGAFWINNEDFINNNWNIHLSDSSVGMIQESKINLSHLSNINFWVFPITSIAFNDNIFNVVFANHMLYHVNHISAGLLEIKRVLAPDGIFYATTGSVNHRKELFELIEIATGIILPNEIGTFSDQNARSILTDYFDNIEISTYKDVLNITESHYLIEYLNSLKFIKSQDDKFKSKLFDYIHNYFALNESFPFTKELVLLSCSD